MTGFLGLFAPNKLTEFGAFVVDLQQIDACLALASWLWQSEKTPLSCLSRVGDFNL
jgi:hypothetical protein